MPGGYGVHQMRGFMRIAVADEISPPCLTIAPQTRTQRCDPLTQPAFAKRFEPARARGGDAGRRGVDQPC